jgi:mannose-6-phosphate isomerase-like protein (cupin superfamily)
MMKNAVARPGDRYLLAGAELITFILRGQEYSLLENATQAGYAGPPPHRHSRQDEGFYVLEGWFTFHVDGKTIQVSAGQFANVQKGSAHTFQNTGSGVGRMLVIVAPAGDFERFIEEAGERVTTTTPPAPPTGPPDAAVVHRLLAAAQRNYLEILLPPGLQP